MERLIRVDLHLHSNLSDGNHSMRRLANMLARRKVEVAALTDHDSIDGLNEFRQLMKEKGIGFVPGVEITTQTIWGEVHLLAYGFDADNPELKNFLKKNLLSREGEREISGDSGPLKIIGKNKPKKHSLDTQSSYKELNFKKCVKIVHESGGKVFLAHPLTISDRWEYVERAVEEFAEAGLDGIEAIYGKYGYEEQQELLNLAERLGLYVTAGSDFHNFEDSGRVGKDIPKFIWKDFRSAVTSSSFADGAQQSGESDDVGDKEERKNHWKSFFARIVIPTFVSFLLFILTLFMIVVPKFESILMERKKELIRELTNSAISTLSQYNKSVKAGKMSEAEARRAAVNHIKNLRYGKENKDYFWIIDTHPFMIVHPYRPELNNTDVSDYRDSNDVRVFVEFVKAVQENDEGYVEYSWQWKDDESRIVPKLSYVKKFIPWNWIIGTGIYLNDVEEEISGVTKNLINIIIVIAVLLGSLLAFVAMQSFRIEKSRYRAELAFRSSHEKYRHLVEASTEGTMIITDGRCRYSNKTMQDLLLYSEEEMYLMDASDIIKSIKIDGKEDSVVTEELMNNTVLPEPVEAELLTRSGKPKKVLIITSKINFSGQEGLIITAKEISGEMKGERVMGYEAIASLNQKLLIDELQQSVHFFTRRVDAIMKPPVTCRIDISITRLIELMKQKVSSSVIVHSESGIPVGIVTDRDLRERLLYKGFTGSVHEIMSAPLITIFNDGLMYEALARMKKHGIDHLPVKKSDNTICGIVNARDLLELLYYSFSNFYWQIHGANSPDEIIGIVENVRDLLTPLVEETAQPGIFSHILAGIMDRISVKFIEFGIKELGPLPARCAFIAIGSHGRKELTLSSDQDNAFIYSNVKENRDRTAKYFQDLGEYVNNWLAVAGFAKCNGGMMAGNPKWCNPISEWKKIFLKWIEEPDEQELIEFNIFFDFRCIFGDQSLTEELRSYIDGELKNNRPFFIHAAKNSLHYKSPIGAFGNLITTSNEDGERVVQIKNALLQLINFARIYALENGVLATNTVERFNNLVVDGIIQKAIYEEAVQAYNYLMAIRLRSQVNRGEKPDRRGVRISELSSLERSMLKQVFSHLNVLNKNISSHFLGV